MKMAALALKAVFLFSIAPSLPAGVFGTFAFATATALIVARLVTLGALEQLPLTLSSRPELENPAVLASVLLAVGAGGLLAFFRLNVEIWWTVPALSCVMSAEFILGGVFRRYWVLGWEILLNLPWLIFVGALSILPPVEENLYTWYLVGHLASLSLLVAWHLPTALGRQRTFEHDRPPIRASLAEFAQSGVTKLGLDLYVFASSRSPVLLPPLLGLGPPPDGVALAVALGESASQVGMVAVNRNYARSASRGPSTRNLVRSVTAYLTIGLVVVTLTHSGPGRAVVDASAHLGLFEDLWAVVSAEMAAWAVLSFAGVLAIVEVRNYLWAARKPTWRVAVTVTALYFIDAAAITLLPPAQWLTPIAVAKCVAAGVVLGVSLRPLQSDDGIDHAA